MNVRSICLSLLVASSSWAITTTHLYAANSVQERADSFLKLVNSSYQALYRVENEAQWLAATDVSSEHDASAETAGKARAAFNGNPAIITEARELLKSRDK